MRLSIYIAILLAVSCFSQSQVKIPDSSASLYLIRNFQTFDKFNCLSACNENPQCISCVYDNNEICSLYNISIEANTLSLTSADSYIKDICKKQELVSTFGINKCLDKNVNMLNFLPNAITRHIIYKYGTTNLTQIYGYEYSEITGMYYINDYDYVTNSIVVFNSNWIYQYSISIAQPMDFKIVGNYMYVIQGGLLKRYVFLNNSLVFDSLSYDLGGTLLDLEYDSKNNILIVAKGDYIYTFNPNLVLQSSVLAPNSVRSIGVFNNKYYIGTTFRYTVVIDNNIITNRYNNTCLGSFWITSVIFDQNGYMLVSCRDEKKLYLHHANGTYIGVSLQTTIKPLSAEFDTKGRLVVVGFGGIEIFY